MHADSVQFFPTGPVSKTFGYNQYPYLGPTLILNKGQVVNLDVTNSIDDTTTVHWHGLHVPSMWDGGPHTPILAGEVWHPTFTVMDHAATYWYHPHWHMKTAKQAIKGAAGLIIVRDSVERSLNLPRKYGIDDFPIIVQCQQYDSLNQAMHLGMQDSTILVNGARANNGYSIYGEFPAQIVRMRLLNASGERTFKFGFTNNFPFHQIASDGGLLNAPFETTRVLLSPGERAEILIDLSALNGQTLDLMNFGSELAMGIQGGPTMPMPSGPPMDSPLNGINYSIFQIHVVAPTTEPVTSIPTTLANNIPYLASDANITRTIRFTADSMMVMDGPFYFNDSLFNMMRIDYMIPLNNVEIWKLVNETMVAHPFHIHDVQFYLLNRNETVQPTPAESGRKDVILVPPGDSLKFITKFEDFADPMVPYMFHCHILMHEDAGMMGQFIVSESMANVPPIPIQSDLFELFPNPAQTVITLRSKLKDTSLTLEIVDNLGKKWISKSSTKAIETLNIESLESGIYTVLIHEKNATFHHKFVKN
jgi:bilirubin oxidase